MREIALSRGLVALVDDNVYEELNQDKWYATKDNKTCHAVRWTKGNRSNRRLIFMHRCILGYPQKGEEIDHINGNGLDNRLINLRFVTRRQNQQNRIGTCKSSRYPGVSWRKDIGKWRSRIRIKGKTKLLGNFSNESEAFQEYKKTVESLGETVVGY